MPVATSPKALRGTTRIVTSPHFHLDILRCSVQSLSCLKRKKCTERPRQFGILVRAIRSPWHGTEGWFTAFAGCARQMTFSGFGRSTPAVMLAPAKTRGRSRTKDRWYGSDGEYAARVDGNGRHRLPKAHEELTSLSYPTHSGQRSVTNGIAITKYRRSVWGGNQLQMLGTSKAKASARGRKAWKRAIVKALRDKGFTPGGARKTANKVMALSIAKRERETAAVCLGKKEPLKGSLSSYSGVTAVHRQAMESRGTRG